jgi:hypothetical protein
LARLRRNQASWAEAAAVLQAVYDRFTEGFETADLKAAKALLAAGGQVHSEKRCAQPIDQSPGACREPRCCRVHAAALKAPLGQGILEQFLDARAAAAVFLSFASRQS